MGRLRTFVALPIREQVVLLWAATLLITLEPAASLLSFARLRRLLDVVVRTVPSGARRGVTVDDVAWAIEAADRALPGSRACLARSLATETVLRHYGHSPRHRIGVARGEDGSFEAHSWVECGDEIPIGELEDMERFSVFPSSADADEEGAERGGSEHAGDEGEGLP